MEKLVVVRTLEQLKEVTDYINANDYIAFDTETTGLSKESKIIGFSISAHDNIGYYVVFSEWDVKTQQLNHLETNEHAKELMALLATKRLIMHNGVFDCNMVHNNYHIDLIDSLYTDTMILAHLLDENRYVGLKELGVGLFGEDAKQEQVEMKKSITANGGRVDKGHYELYKADSELIAKYGAKDAVLTIKIFYIFIEQLMEQGLTDFFFTDESMPLLKGPTYDLNTTGLKVDTAAMAKLKGELEVECMELEAQIYNDITPLIKETYPGDKKSNKFNINSGKQLAWLLYYQLKQPFNTLTKEGKNLCKALDIKVPYSHKAKYEFLGFLEQYKGLIWDQGKFNPKTKKVGKPKKIGDPWNYLAADKEALTAHAKRYKWVDALLRRSKAKKILDTYVIGVQERLQYGIIRPSFLQHGTTSGRYSSRDPNFQNLPRDDKRVKACIISRPGKVFVGADYSQLEPRVFASFSGDERLLNSFKSGDDFYSTIGMAVFGLYDAKPLKEDFGVKYKKYREIAKVVALSSTYGTTAFKMAGQIGRSSEEAQEVIDDYFEQFPKVKQLMLESHEIVKRDGQITNLFGRPRRVPLAKAIPKIYGKSKHADLPYEARRMLNLAINHRIQSTGASIINRAAIAFHKACKELSLQDIIWKEVKIVLQVHDELVVECPEKLAEAVSDLLKYTMENTVTLPGVELEAKPVIAKNLADLK